MAKKFLTPIDLAKNELQNARLQNLATAPAAPVVGQIYYDTTSGAGYQWNGAAWRPLDAGKLVDGSVPLAALSSNPLARANHTGTQAAATISDLAAVVKAYRLDEFAEPMAAVSAGGQKMTNVATPTIGSDAANKQYVDDTVASISWKNEVRIATTVNAALATAYANGQTVDGVVLASGDRILLKDQATASENGIYTVNPAGAPTRATDADSDTDFKGAALFVAQGTTNGGTRWVCNTTGTITLGSTAISFVQFGGGSTYTAGNGLALAAGEFSVGAGVGIAVAADTVGIDTAVVVRKVAANVGDNSATAIAVTHNLGTLDVTVGVFTNADGAEVECDIAHTSVNVVTLTFATAPTTSQYRCVVHG